MQLATAKKVFASLMQKAREKQLSALEKQTLSRARQTIRQQSRPAMNAPAGAWEFVKTVAERYGIHVSRNRPGDGKTRYSFYKVDAQGRETKHLYTAVGIKEATTYINAFRDGKENPRRTPTKGTRPSGLRLQIESAGGKWYIFDKAFNEVKAGPFATRTEAKDAFAIIKSRSRYTTSPRHHAEIGFKTKYPGGQKAHTNPRNAVKIYGRCLRIEAVKMRSHTYGGKKAAATQRYFHDFTAKNAMIYGLPDGSLLIKAK
jgi:hypothetical protein